MIVTADLDMAIKYFDTLEYVKESTRIKDPGELAGYQVKQMEKAIETAVRYVESKHENFIPKAESNELAKKVELEKFSVDLERFATKKDLERFATKEDLKEFATKKDLEAFATKKDLELTAIQLRSEMKDFKFDIVKWMIGLVVPSVLSATALLAGMLAHGFHWF